VTFRSNITAAGRWVRAISGLVLIALAALLIGLAWPVSAAARWVAVALLVLLGLFQLFEARKGWCVLRACRIKTPI